MSPPLGVTDVGGFDRAEQAFAATLGEIEEPERGHPHVRIGHALLWANVLNDAYFRAGGDAYSTRRHQDADGAPMWWLVMAFNALKHGAALCADLKPDIEVPGVRIGQWTWVADVDLLAESLGRQPAADQRETYEREIAGRPLAEPFVRVSRWFTKSKQLWPV